MARNLSITAIVLLIPAVLLQNGAMLGAAFLLLAASLLSAAWGRRIGASLEVARHMNPRAYLNDVIDVTLQMRKRSRLPALWLRVRDSVPVEVGPHSFNRAIALKSQEMREFHYTLLANRRGLYRIGPVTLYAGDVLGLDEVLHRQAVVQTLTVYPKIVSLEALGLPSRSPLARAKRRSNSSATGWPGTRRPTVSWPPVTASGTQACFFRISVSGPGQKVSINSQATGGTCSAQWSTAS